MLLQVSFAARTLLPQFKSFKSNFNFSSSGPGWVTIAVPWNQFSNDWSPFTGDCDTKDPTGWSTTRRFQVLRVCVRACVLTPFF